MSASLDWKYASLLFGKRCNVACSGDLTDLVAAAARLPDPMLFLGLKMLVSSVYGMERHELARVI